MARRVLERLIHGDNILIELKDMEGNDENSILVVHPNYNPEEAVSGKVSGKQLPGSPTKASQVQAME
jgi:hypothetical protein